MGMIVTYPDTKNRWHDTEKITLDKILQQGTGGGGAGLEGAGPPGAGLGVSGSTYWDTTNKDFYVKDGSTWQLLVDIV